LHRIAWLLAGLALLTLVALGWFEALHVQPVAHAIRGQLAAADPAERAPPAVLAQLIQRSHGKRLPELVVLTSSWTASAGTQERKASIRQLTLQGQALLLPLRLSDQELQAAFLSQAWMGLEPRGFAAASQHYLGRPLAEVSATQAAQLVALSHAPASYLANPQRWARRTQHLLEQAAQTPQRSEPRLAPGPTGGSGG